MTETTQTEEEAIEPTPPSRLDAWRSRAPSVVAILAALLVGLGLGATCGDEPAAPAADPDTAEHSEHTVWTCAMHPQVQSEEPGECPICGMDLVPLAGDGGEDASPVRVQLSERAQILAEIRTTQVRHLRDEARTLELLGRVDYDETRLRTVTSWTDGRIDRLHVATTGAEIASGQTIATIYSPDIYTAHRDLIQALRQVRRLAGGMEFARNSAEATVESARQKLRLLGVSKSQLEEMEKADEPWTQVKIRARSGGTVIERLLNEGAYIEAGTGIYRVADLGALWVQLDAYEADLPRLRKGQTVELTTTALPDEVFEGKIAFIDPVVDAMRRTARVRVEVNNKDRKLKPGMFVEAVVEGDAAPDGPAPLVIPDSAPLFSGRRSLVYVEVPGAERPTYEAREVKLGPRAGGVFPVLGGLVAGERVVTHGAFAIDADLQIEGGASLMTRRDVEVSAAFHAALKPVVTHYLAVQEALADDDLLGAQAAAKAVVPAARAIDAKVWTQLGAEIVRQADEIVSASSIDEAREHFAPLSEAVIGSLERFGNPTEDTLHVAFCPMVFGNRGAEWIQRGAVVDNAYFGARMLTCGETRAAVAPGAVLVRGDEP